MERFTKHLGLFLRVLISLGVLGYLATKMDWVEFFGVVSQAKGEWLLGATLLVSVPLVLSTWRWRILLQVQAIHLSYRHALEICLIGSFFNSFLLGVTGGDVAKIYYTAQARPQQRSAAGMSVVYDRVLGLLALIVWGLVLTPFFYGPISANAVSLGWLGVFFMIAAGAGGFTLLLPCLPWLRRHSGLGKLEQKLPFRGTIERLSEAFLRYATAWQSNAKAFALSLTIHLFIFAYMYAAALALQLEVPFWSLLGIIAVVNILIAIPMSISGLGLREGLFALFLSAYGIGHEKAVAFSLVVFAISLGWSLLGGLVYLRYRRPDVKPTHPIENTGS
jgi:glycosyltransferase 2 family protein